MAIDPTCTINALTSVGGQNVTAASTVTIQLASLAGVNTWSLTCIGTDELLVASTVTAGLSINNVTKSATLTAPAAGSALIFQSLVNGGVDVNGVAQASYKTTFAVYVLTAGGLRVGAVNETTEGSAAFGWLTKVNAQIRTPSGGGTAPTGTGWYHATAGAMDAAAITAGDSAIVGGAFTVASLTGAAGTLSVASTAAIFSWAAAAAAPTLSQVAKASDLLPQNFTIAPQAPFVTATGANRAAGSFVVNAAAPTNGGTAEAGIVMQRAGVSLVSLQAQVSSPTWGAVYLGSAAATPAAANYALASPDGVTVLVNATTTLSLRVNGAEQAQLINGGMLLTAAAAYIGIGASPGGGAGQLPTSGALRLANAAAIVGANSVGSGVPLLQISAGNLVIVGDQTLAANVTIDSSGAAYFRVSSGRYGMDASGFTIGSIAGSYGGGVGVVSLLNAGTAPTSNPTGGCVAYAVGGGFAVRSDGGLALVTDKNKLSTKFGINRAVRRIAASATLTVADDVVMFSASAQTATLPASPTAGDKYTVGLSVATGTFTIASNAGAINILWIATTGTSITNNVTTTQAITVQYDGTNWVAAAGY